MTTLFDLKPDAQSANLARVSERIGAYIVDYFRAHGTGARFHLAELHAYVTEKILCAPGSVDRILRDLRTRKLLDYAVISRRGSLYQIERV